MAKTILVVEDFEDTRFFMKVLLERFGYEVLQAENGFKAVEIVKRQLPDLIIMDMALPVISGLSTTKIIRQFEETAEIPIIAFTASGDFIYQQAIDAGCNDLLTKPLDIDRLKVLLKKYLKK